MNQPSISGVQIVGKTKVAANQKNLPLNGDYDKDVVIGDNGKVNMTVDVPFGFDANPNTTVNPLQNKTYEAVSDTTSFNAGTVASQSDWISTGRNQDIVLGGNGADSIDSGAGDDVVLGDNGQIEMTDFNPIGVRQPLNLNILDAKSADNATYIGKPGFNNGQFVQKITSNLVPGVMTIASSQAGNDIVDAGKDNDLVYGQEGNDLLLGNSGTDDVLYDNVGTNKVKDTNYPTAAAYNADLVDILTQLDAAGKAVMTEFVGNDFGKATTLGVIAQGLGATVPTPPTGQTVDLSGMTDVVLTMKAGDTVVLTATNWPGKGNSGWSPNIALVFSSNNVAIPGITASWLVGGVSQSKSLAAGSWYSLMSEIPDSPNDNGAYKITLKADTAGTFKVKLTNA